MSYLDELLAMPPEVRRIADMCWDETGRPRCEDPYITGVVNLLNLCDDMNEYTLRYSQLFGDVRAAKDTTAIRTQWCCHYSGLERCARAMEKIAEEV